MNFIKAKVARLRRGFGGQPRQKMKVLVGMSGGVDSSVAAALLVRQGYEVTGGFIKNWSDSKDFWTGECQWRGERRDAMRVAAALGITLVTFDFEKEYKSRVIDRMFREYEAGITPNPDVLCNEEIKFGLFFEKAMKRGFDFVATGHYAQIRRGRKGVAHLLRGKDPLKDQAYFLYRLKQEVLKKVLFPVGHLKKTDVRRKAEKWKLPTAHKPDSQGICFVGKLDFHKFLRKKIKERPGEIVTIEGKVVGRHDGLDAFTIGQRQGLLVSKDREAWYVAAKDREKNQILVVPKRDHPLLFKKTATINDVNWITGKPPDRHRVDVMIRYRQKPEIARLFKLHDHRYKLEFKHPVWALAPGQSAVLYQGKECLGGGFIMES